MASTFIFLTKFCLIFVIHQRVNAKDHDGNCKVNETTGVIMEIRFQEPPMDLSCSSGGSQKAVWVDKSAHWDTQQNRENKNWMAFNCKVAGSGSGSNATFCVHGPNISPTISGTNTLVSGVPTEINCTINGVHPAPRIEWNLEDTGNITMDATLEATSDSSTRLFNATSSLSFTPKLEHDGLLLTCRVLPPVPNVWTPSNASVDLNITDDSNKSGMLEVQKTTSSSLCISWQLHEDNMAGSSMLTLRYCRNGTGDLDNVTTMDNLTCPSYKEVGLNGTSYNLTGLEPFQWYNLTLLADGNTVALKIASTAPLSPEYYGVYMTFSPEEEILEISRLPMMNRTVPSDLCFAIIQTEGSTPNCSSHSLKCLEPGEKINDFEEEDIPGIGLVSSGRGLCSQQTLSPIILNSPGGMMDMPHISIVMVAVIGTSVFILLSTVALLLFLNFICKGIGCLGKKDKDIDEDETLVQVIRKDNSRKVDKDGLVYVDIAHEKSHPADAPPIRTEEPTVYALVETGVMGSCKKDDDGLVYVEVSHEHDHPAGAPPIQTEKPTVYATLDMEAMASLKEKEGKEEMGGAKDGEEGGTDQKESVKEKKKSVKEENKDVKDDGEGVKEEKEVVEKKKESVKEKKKSVKKDSKDVKDDKEGVKEEKEKVEKEKEGGEKAPEDKFSPVDKKPNYENITFTDDGLAITLETHL